MMNETCKDRERIFEDGTPGEWAALEAHSANCPVCAEELKAWKSLSVAAQEVLVLTISAGWLYIYTPNRIVENDKSLLKSTALENVERAEAVYVQAIDKLAEETKPQLENPATPLLANYHEKLVVLDSAIADLRAQAGVNPSNAQLRHQLLAMYQEKQHTLEEVLEARKQ